MRKLFNHLQEVACSASAVKMQLQMLLAINRDFRLVLLTDR